MILISKEEAEYLRQHGIREGITRTMRTKSKRHRIWAAEDRCIMDLLEEYRKSLDVVMVYGKN